MRVKPFVVLSLAVAALISCNQPTTSKIKVVFAAQSNGGGGDFSIGYSINTPSNGNVIQDYNQQVAFNSYLSDTFSCSAGDSIGFWATAEDSPGTVTLSISTNGSVWKTASAYFNNNFSVLSTGGTLP